MSNMKPIKSEHRGRTTTGWRERKEDMGVFGGEETTK